MQLEELRQLDIHPEIEDAKVDIEFDHVEQRFTDTDRVHVLYSRVHYETGDFVWDSVLPTVEIPYRDPSCGFLLGGVVFTSVGIYQRAPGVVLGKEKDLPENPIDRVDIVTARNTTLTIGTWRNGIQIEFKKGDKKRRVPVGVFLKAISGLPYDVILKRFAYKPPTLLNAFPCSIPKRAVDLAKSEIYGIDSDVEPTIEECVSEVYNAIVQVDLKATPANYSSHWKANRIRSYLEGLSFKSEQNYESNLSLHSRVVDTYLDQELKIDFFNESGEVETHSYHRGTFIDEEFAEVLRWHDVSKLRVKTNRSFLVQEDTPVLFRALGYRLHGDLPAVGGSEGDLIDKELLKAINSTDIKMLEVDTPDGYKVLSRSLGEPELGDFCTILNTLFTAEFKEQDTVSQYEIANRIVVDYDRQVMLEVSQTYQEIVTAISGCVQLKYVLESLPKLPSTRLYSHLRDANTRELAQAETTNIMARAISERRASALMKDVPAAMTAVQKGQYARIDSLHAPESDRVGAVQELTAMAVLDSANGNMLAPYEIVRDGKPTGEIEYISAAKEASKYIVGWDDKLEDDIVMARYNGSVTTVARERVSYRDASPFCDMSISRMTIPFPEFSQPRRSLMATKMQGQAVPLLKPERPLVSTGADTEIPCLYYTARDVVKSSLGEQAIKENELLEVVSVKWTKLSAKYTCSYNGTVFQFSVPFMATDKETVYNYNLNFREDCQYRLDDVVFYNQSCDMNVTGDDGRVEDTWTRVEQGALPVIKNFGKPAMALGTNLVVMFKTFGSSTADDAVVINDRLIDRLKLTTVQIHKYDYELRNGESFHPYNSVPALHSWVYPQQPIIKVLRSARGDEETSREKSVLCDVFGEVVWTDVNEAEQTAEVWVSCIHDPALGDKVAGRHGNKSVIAKIVPNDMMPYDPETGMTADIVCNPLGIPSRMNYGQLLEIHLGMAMLVNNQHAVITPFYPNAKKEVQDAYEACGMQAKRLYLPEYGKMSERPIMMGVMYFMKLEQMANLKYSAVGYPKAVDPVFGQPGSSANDYKGQRIGEMESWALAAAGANKILTNMFTMYAPDEASRKRYFYMLGGNQDSGPGTWDENQADALAYKVDNKDSIVTQTVIRCFGLDLEVGESGGHKCFRYLPLNMDDIKVIATTLDLRNHNEGTEENEWCKVKLRAKVISPFWIRSFPLHAVLGVKSVKTLVSGDYMLNSYTRELVPKSKVEDYERAAMVTGIDAVIGLLENTTIDDAIKRLSKDGNLKVSLEPDIDDSQDSAINVEFIDVTDGGEESDSTQPRNTETANATTEGRDHDENDDTEMRVKDIIRFLLRMKEAGMELRDLIWEYFPIMPKVFRQTSMVNGVERERSFQKQLVHLVDCSTSADLYTAFEQFIGYGASKSNDLVSVRGYFFGKNSASGNHGTVRTNVMSKRIGFSGRCVIIPAPDWTMSPFFVGIPWIIAMTELSKVLAIRMRNRAVRMSAFLRDNINGPTRILEGIKPSEWEEIIESLWQFNPYVFEKYFPDLSVGDQHYLYNCLRAEIRSICEGDVTPDGRINIDGTYYNVEDVPQGVTIDAMVVQIGRQPTLHARSTRAYFGKLVDGFALHIHPLVCGGFNADFDGDTMWDGQLFGEMKNEAWMTISSLQDLVSGKDGGFALCPTQDSMLGIYATSIFKDNAATFNGHLGQYHYFTDAAKLKHALEYGDLNYYDAVIFKDLESGRRYISTAGRILVNASVPGAFTDVPFTDTFGICTAVLGAEAISAFNQLKYDGIYVATSIKAEGREHTIKVEKILLDTYHEYGNRTAVLTAQALYEIGVVASDIYSVTASMDDISVNVDVTSYMDEPKKVVNKLNTLEQMGLISEHERKRASVRAWDNAKKAATTAVVAAIPPNSNIHLLMYSGARGKPDQVMQAVGFIGSISKSATEDIEYPILKGYGTGLSSLDQCQTREMARMGVVSTQTGTKDTGYSTRQTVYMTSGLKVKEDDCGIEWRTQRVAYSSSHIDVTHEDGTVENIDDLEGKFLDPTDDTVMALLRLVGHTSHEIDEDVIYKIISLRLTSLKLSDEEVKIHHYLDPNWRKRALEEGYSYALPFTINRKITDESLDWVEEHGLSAVVMFDEDESEGDKCFDREAYLPVNYDYSKYSLSFDGRAVGDEALYGRQVSEESEGYHYYVRLLDADSTMSVKALRYLTKKGIRSIQFVNGSTVTVKYQLADLFKQLVLGRLSEGLPALDEDECITDDTLRLIEDVQLESIPVRTSLTCTCVGGMCSLCAGKSPSSRDFLAVGADLGISAAQAQCEPLSQATLNVTHSGGKRGAGVGLVSGLSYYMKMLHGQSVPKSAAHLLETYAPVAGYIKCNQHDSHYFQIVDKDNKVLHAYSLDDPDRLNVVDGAYVDAGDTIIAGATRLNRYGHNRNIFMSALKTRYLLLKEYYRIFKALNVSPRNYEILARAQSSICYLDANEDLPTTQDTSVEINSPTNAYILEVAKQSEVVNKYSGIAGFAFENVAAMLNSGVLESKGLELNSVLGNIVTGTPVGSTEPKFIPKQFGTSASRYRKSTIKEAEEQIRALSEGRVEWKRELLTAPEQTVDRVAQSSASLLEDLFRVEAELSAGQNAGLLGDGQGDGKPMAKDNSFDLDAMPETVRTVRSRGKATLVSDGSGGIKRIALPEDTVVETGDTEPKPSFTIEVPGYEEDLEPRPECSEPAGVVDVPWEVPSEEPETSAPPEEPEKKDYDPLKGMKLE